jgi:TonB family protein
MNLLRISDFAILLLACAVKASLLFGFAWIGAFVARRQSAALRHRMWAAGILGSLALPVFTLLLPEWHSSALVYPAAVWSATPAAGSDPGFILTLPSMMVEATTSSPLFDRLFVVAMLVWAVGLLLIALRLLAGLVWLAWIAAHSQPVFEEAWMRDLVDISGRYGISRSVRILRCASPLAMPLTWGIFRPIIVLPAVATDWSQVRRRVVLCHELAHIARGDWLTQICAEMLRALYWFHPLAWLAAMRLRQESECACDDSVLNSGFASSEYAEQLLDLARNLASSSHAWSAALAFARPSNLERRFAAMLSPKTNRRGLSPASLWITVVAALCLLFPLAALRLPAQAPSAAFSGTITDPSGAHVPNATVILTNHKTNAIEMTTSGADGNFNFKSIPAGEYEIKVLKRGFEQYKVPQIVLEAGRENSQNATLEIGAVTEEMDVGATGRPKLGPAEAGRKPTRIRIGGDVQAPKALTKVPPVYPPGAKAAGIEGAVILHAVIGTDGKPLSLRVMNTEIDPELARASIEAVSKWRYSPTLLNGEPVEVDTTIIINFTLAP